VRALYGVAASTEQPPDGEAVTFTVHASKEKPVADRPVQIAAAVTTDDVRKAFYDNAPHDAWICEIQLDPLQLIVTRDDGSYARVPVTVNGDGSFTFGPMVPVQVTYVDDPTPAVAASADYLPKFKPGEASPSPPTATITGGQLVTAPAPRRRRLVTWVGVASRDAVSGTSVRRLHRRRAAAHRRRRARRRRAREVRRRRPGHHLHVRHRQLRPVVGVTLEAASGAGSVVIAVRMAR
jgi:hypothetical protein